MLRKTISFYLPTFFRLSLLLVLFVPVFAQDKRSSAPAPKLIKRTIIKRESTRIGYGSTFTLVGAPQGSISIEGWSRSEMELSAEIELQAESEEELNQLALVNGFILEEPPNHVRILSVGSHDKKYLKRVARNFPKKLLNLPWKIDYRIRVPEACDLEINAGRGPITIKNVVGSLALTASESVADLTLTSGVVNVTIGSGKLDVKIPVRSWRGSGADIKLAVGEMTVELPAGFNGEMDATILRSGKINDSFGELEPLQRHSITPQLVRARAGAGGAAFRFTVADGTITIKKTGL
jgi:hypothetical protein